MLRELWSLATAIALMSCGDGNSTGFNQSSRKPTQAQSEDSESNSNSNSSLNPMGPSNPVDSVNPGTPTKPINSNPPVNPSKPVVVKPNFERGTHLGLLSSTGLFNIILQIQSADAIDVTILTNTNASCKPRIVLTNSNANTAIYRLSFPSNVPSACACTNGILQLNKTAESVDAQIKCSNKTAVDYSRLQNCAKKLCA